MKCDKCKTNEADIYIGYLKENRQKNISLCESCSDSMGISTYVRSDYESLHSSDELQQFSIDHNIHCPYCLTDLVHLFSTGQTGCPQCYSIFKKEIDHNFNKKKEIADKNSQYSDILRDRLNEFIEN